MKRLENILGGLLEVVFMIVLFVGAVVFLVTLATASVLRWVLLVSTQLVASFGLSQRQREIMISICSFVSARDDEEESRFIGHLMWEPGDHGPYQPFWLIEKLEERRFGRYRRLAEARRAGIAFWRIRLARCVS